jgi:hypothetical protein
VAQAHTLRERLLLLLQGLQRSISPNKIKKAENLLGARSLCQGVADEYPSRQGAAFCLPRGWFWHTCRQKAHHVAMMIICVGSLALSHTSPLAGAAGRGGDPASPTTHLPVFHLSYSRPARISLRARPRAASERPPDSHRGAKTQHVLLFWRPT